MTTGREAHEASPHHGCDAMGSQCAINPLRPHPHVWTVKEVPTTATRMVMQLPWPIGPSGRPLPPPAGLITSIRAESWRDGQTGQRDRAPASLAPGGSSDAWAPLAGAGGEKPARLDIADLAVAVAFILIHPLRGFRSRYLHQERRSALASTAAVTSY